MNQLWFFILCFFTMNIFAPKTLARYVDGDYRGPEIVRVLHKDDSQSKPIITYLRIYYVGLVKIDSCEDSICTARTAEITQDRAQFIQELALAAVSDGSSQIKQDIQCKEVPISTDVYLKSNTYSLRGKFLAMTSDSCNFQLYKNEAGLELIRTLDPILKEFLNK